MTYAVLGSSNFEDGDSILYIGDDPDKAQAVRDGVGHPTYLFIGIDPADGPDVCERDTN